MIHLYKKRGDLCTAVFVSAALLCLISAAAVPQERPPDMSVRHPEGNVLVSPDQPKIRLQVDKAFTALPQLAFPIRQDTWVERYIFVDSSRDMTVSRLVVVQFEHAQVGSAFQFVYPARPRCSGEALSIDMVLSRQTTRRRLRSIRTSKWRGLNGI